MVEWSTQTLPASPDKRPVSPSNTAWGVLERIEGPEFPFKDPKIESISSKTTLTWGGIGRAVKTTSTAWVEELFLQMCFELLKKKKIKLRWNWNQTIWTSYLGKLLRIFCWRWKRCELGIPKDDGQWSQHSAQALGRVIDLNKYCFDFGGVPNHIFGGKRVCGKLWCCWLHVLDYIIQ